MARFSFTGNLNLNGLDSKVPYYREGKTSSGKNYKIFNASVVAAKNNRAYVECFGMVQDVIKTMDNESPKANKVEIAWNDRKDPDVVKSVAGFRKHVYKTDDARKEYIADYDFVEDLIKDAEELKNGKYTITGTTSVNVYQGKISQRYNIQSVYAVAEDAKCGLKVNDIFYWNKDGVDTANWSDEKKIYLNGYVSEYVDKEMQYIPFTAVLDCSKLDFENEKHMKMLKFKLSGLGLSLIDGKIKCVFKKNNYYKQNIEFAYNNGAEEVPFDESLLTDFQKEQIELGLKTVDDFKPAGSTFGERKVEYKIVGFNSKGEFENGYVEADSESDFEEHIYIAPKEESLDDIEKKPTESKTEVEEDDDDDLFG